MDPAGAAAAAEGPRPLPGSAGRVMLLSEPETGTKESRAMASKIDWYYHRKG